jgi:8-oxo-dGTP pyrophosphatase MutT (NUDIX family)
MLQIGVGGFVYRSDVRQVLVVCERKRLIPAKYWKLPGGLADPGEEIAQTGDFFSLFFYFSSGSCFCKLNTTPAIREVFEETGVETAFESLLAFRQVHNMPKFNHSDIYFVVRLKSLTTAITMDPHELEDCRWMDVSLNAQ